MKFLSLIIPVLLLMQVASYSQTTGSEKSRDEIFKRLSKKRPGQGEISVVQDARLEEVLSEYISINQQKNGIPAYWIRIYSGSGHDAREKAYQTKAKFLTKYEGIKDKVVYDDPNFKVYIGGYRVKSEALKLLKTIQRDFPSAFIVYDIIDFPDL
jgi:SPOR domain